MANYKAPLRDMKFVHYELLDGNALTALPGYEEATEDLVDAILEEAGKVAEGVLHPINRTGDEEGCTFENGVVRTPSGFKEAYDTFIEGGWTTLTCDPEFGGQGLPHSVGLMVSEMMSAANQAFAMYPGLSHGAYNALEAHGSDDLKQTYLPKLTDGTWSGTMCLTEPQCGTDLGLVRTKAIPQDDGSYKITGTKIFISAGDHDLTENILHLVLAKLPDAPEGIKGISLFLVPKYLPAEDGSAGPANGVSCGSIEHKMGINGNATCVINFDDATGWLVGEPHKGMRAMFTFMNTARLGVGLQGLAQGEAAYQGALEYARERIQGRSLTGPKELDKKADSILVHPDVRRMLLTIKAYTEGSRALTGWIAQEIDYAHKSPDPQRAKQADDLASLLTPIIKAFQTDAGYESANMGVQVFGGHGYIREHGMEQIIRDCRIAQIYEGTNGIQALDLVGRKLPTGMGRLLRRFFHPVQEFIAAEMENDEMEEFVMPLAKNFGRLQQVTAWLAEQGMKNPDEAGAASVEYLRMFGLVAMGYMWARMAKIGLAKQDGDEAVFYKSKVKTARFYMARLLPLCGGLMSSIMAGSSTIMDFEDELFG